MEIEDYSISFKPNIPKNGSRKKVPKEMLSGFHGREPGSPYLIEGLWVKLDTQNLSGIVLDTLCETTLKEEVIYCF